MVAGQLVTAAQVCELETIWMELTRVMMMSIDTSTGEQSTSAEATIPAAAVRSPDAAQRALCDVSCCP